MDDAEKRAEIARLQAELATTAPTEASAVSTGLSGRTVALFTTAAVAGCILFVVLVAALTDDEPAATASLPVATTGSALSTEQLFLRTVREQVRLDDVSDAALLDAGQSVCYALDRDAAPVDVLATAMEQMPEGGVQIIGSAVAILCREHMAAMQELAGQ